MYIFRDLESVLSKTKECLDLKDGDACLRKAKRWWRLVAILTFTSFVMLVKRGENESNNLAACFPQDS